MNTRQMGSAPCWLKCIAFQEERFDNKNLQAMPFSQDFPTVYQEANVYMMTRKFPRLIFSLLFISGCLFAQVQRVHAESSFVVSGAYQATIDDAVSSLNFNKYGGVWTLQVASRPGYVKKSGQGYIVNLFFSKDFTPAEGTFQVKFNYRSEKDTLGGSLVLSGQEREMFSHDTEGTVSFDSFDKQVTGTFAFSSFKGSADSGAPKITTSGTFNLPRGEALP